jgi:chromosome segregation ATPase
MNRTSFSPGISNKEEVFGNEAEMKFLKDETARLTEVLKVRDETISGMHQRISNLSDIKIALSKETKKISSDLKFERIASEGSKKKLAVLDYEVTTLREERANLIAERGILRDRVLELETAVGGLVLIL